MATTEISEADRIVHLAEVAAQQGDTIEFLQESIAELELALDDAGWVRLTFDGDREFSRVGLHEIVKRCRLMFLKSPLVKRGVNVRAFYVWGQGFSIKAKDDKVNEIVQRHVEDPGNKATLYSHAAGTQRERDLNTDGNVFIVCFINKATGDLKIRTIPFDEVQEIFTNPDDMSEPWFYRRVWTSNRLTADGRRESVTDEAWYPDWRYRPTVGSGAGTAWRNRATPTQTVRPTNIDGKRIEWQTPIYHVKTGGTTGMRFGVPPVYASIDWARAHTRFLEDWATIVRSLSRFAWSMTGAKKTRDSVAAKLGTTIGGGEGEFLDRNPPPIAAATLQLPPGAELTPINKSGATVAAEDGRQLRLMVASALGLPDTILAADPDMGNLATAKTLDRPTELEMLDRQELWATVMEDLCGFAVEWNVRSVAGALTGTVKRDQGTGADIASIDGVKEDGIEVTFPPILEHDVGDLVHALVEAVTLNGKPFAHTIEFRAFVVQLLNALGFDKIDEIADLTVAAWEADQAEKKALAEKIASQGPAVPDAPGAPADPANDPSGPPAKKPPPGAKRPAQEKP